MTQNGNPIYSVKYYRDGVYKLVKFPGGLRMRLPKDGLEGETSGMSEEGKCDAAISRAKSVIYQVAVCNDWDYFCTFTLSPEKFDRYDFRPFYAKFSQWVRDYRKHYGCKVEYLLIPEQHEDGAWHMHGLMRGIPQDHLSRFMHGIHPEKLVEGDYLNWGRCGNKFGFCSLAPIRDVMAVAGYVTKYITKDLLQTNTRAGAHLYFCSIGLRRAVQFGYIYHGDLALDARLTNTYQFCQSGWVHDLDWADWLGYMDDILVDFTEFFPEEQPKDGLLTDVWYDFQQLSFDDIDLAE